MFLGVQGLGQHPFPQLLSTAIPVWGVNRRHSVVAEAKAAVLSTLQGGRQLTCPCHGESQQAALSLC